MAEVKRTTWVATVAVQHGWLPTTKLEQFEFDFTYRKTPTTKDVRKYAIIENYKDFMVVGVIKK